MLNQICHTGRCARPTFNAEEEEAGTDALLQIHFLEMPKSQQLN